MNYEHDRLRPVRMALYNVDSKTHEKIASIAGAPRPRGPRAMAPWLIRLCAHAKRPQCLIVASNLAVSPTCILLPVANNRNLCSVYPLVIVLFSVTCPWVIRV
jgi:hypothetical protein